jgi:hypothetical protein
MVVRALETMRKVYLRLPYIDRINVSFAALTVRGEIRLAGLHRGVGRRSCASLNGSRLRRPPPGPRKIAGYAQHARNSA